MGQFASSDNSHSRNTSLELFTKLQIITLFRWRVMNLLSKSEQALVSQKLNVTVANDAHTVTTYSDLAYLLQLQNDKNIDVLSVHSDFATAIKILYGSLKVLGNLPFLQDCLNPDHDDQLTLNGLIIASLVHTGRINKIWQDIDYLKLIFMSLSLSTNSIGHTLNEKSDNGEVEKSARETTPDDPYVAEVLELPNGYQDDTSTNTTAKRIRWSTFKPLKEYDELEVESMEVSASVLVQIFTLLLICNSIPQKAHLEMQKELQISINNKWGEFKLSAILLVRYLNVEITASNLSTVMVTFDQFKSGIETGFRDFVPLAFAKLFKHGIFSLVVADALPDALPEEKNDDDDEDLKKTKKTIKFEETRLVNTATLAYVSVFLNTVGVGYTVSPSNLVLLYNGSNSGFSIRSLELKIIKWQAPTLFLVSGKRLRHKTMTTNKRYQLFDSEYPRYFRSTEDPHREWQSDNDKITYLIYVHQPWRNSNKKNFGDENTAIMCVSPRYDFFKSKPDPINQGRLIYFNNLGMGLGFGNDQPVNKNNVRKYLPGSVSLTLEANLEFGVFRHIANSSANTPSYFNRSEQQVVQSQDYEDRFMITDLEVWGVGSTKELDEQRKQWEWEEKQAKARQSVNMRTLGEDRAFLEMVGLVGNHAGGSMG